MNPTSKTASSANPYAAVQGLHHFGLTRRLDAALLLPVDYEDLANVVDDVLQQAQGKKFLVSLTLSGALRTSFSNGTPRTTAGFLDDYGRLFRGTFFGDSAPWEDALVNGRVTALCQLEIYREEPQLMLVQPVPADWIGRIRPKYKPKPGVLKAEEVREQVLGFLPSAIPMCAMELEKKFLPLAPMQDILAAINAKGWTLTQLLEEAHLPVSIKMGRWARSRIRDLAALGSFMKLQEHHAKPRVARSFQLNTLTQRIDALPYVMTDEQLSVATAMAHDIAMPNAMRRVLIGDVGSGKTCVFGSVAVSVADAGGRVAILAPNLPLAAQIRNELKTTWPEIRYQLVTGESGENIHAATQIAIGTTALLHRAHSGFDFVIVDEEQKFSVGQKNALVPQECHHLTVSATPLPRSLALGRYGAVEVSELREQHVLKFIENRLWNNQERRQLMDELSLYLRDQHCQLLVVYPMRDQDDVPGAEKMAAMQAAEYWERIAPGRVRCLSGDDNDDTKLAVVQDMKENRAQILVATTVVEVGITLPALRRCLVVDPQRHGLMTLHQIRGRVARKGGEGWFDLMPREPLKPDQQTKMERFLTCKNGFEVAELDLQLRGPGDLGVDSSVQSGADRSFLFGQALDLETLASMEPVWQKLTGQ